VLFLYLFLMKYSVNNEQVVFNDHYKMLKAHVTYDTFEGGTITTQRLAFERGDSVAILLYEKDTHSLIFTRQFRYPSTKHGVGWLTEIPAGSLEKDESPVRCAIRETKEEVGYRIEAPEPIMTFYVSPGGCTERCHLFYAAVRSEDQVADGGGNASENEDIKIVKITIEEVEKFLSEKVNDAKTLLAIQWFLLNKATA